MSFRIGGNYNKMDKTVSKSARADKRTEGIAISPFEPPNLYRRFKIQGANKISPEMMKAELLEPIICLVWNL